MPAMLIYLCASTPLDSSQHTLFPCVSPLPINHRPLTPKPRDGIISQGLEASVARCSWIPMCLICRPCLPTHFIQPVSLTAFPGYRMRRSARCARQQQLRLSVISFETQWLAYCMHNKVTPGSYWWSPIGVMHESSLQKMQIHTKPHLSVNLTPGLGTWKSTDRLKQQKKKEWVMGLKPCWLILLWTIIIKEDCVKCHNPFEINLNPIPSSHCWQSVPLNVSICGADKTLNPQQGTSHREVCTPLDPCLLLCKTTLSPLGLVFFTPPLDACKCSLMCKFTNENCSHMCYQ